MAAAEQWPPWAVTSVRTNLGELARLVQEVLTEDPGTPTLNWLSRLLIVRCSGYLEQSVHEITRAHIATRSGGVVRAFAESWLDRSRNPSPEALEKLLGRFDHGWSAEFTDLLEDEDQKLRREISYLVDRRNKIAHGLNEGVTPRRALATVDSAERVVDWFILRLNPYR